MESMIFRSRFFFLINLYCKIKFLASKIHLENRLNTVSQYNSLLAFLYFFSFSWARSYPTKNEPVNVSIFCVEYNNWEEKWYLLKPEIRFYLDCLCKTMCKAGGEQKADSLILDKRST